MTEIQSDDAQPRPVPLHELHGISQEDCLAFIEQSHDHRRKVDSAADKIRRARNIVELLKDADENFADLSLRTLDQLDRVLSLLKSAAKKIDKYGDQQMYRDIESWKQGCAS